MPEVNLVLPQELRGRFARSLSALYEQEVPAYGTLLDVSYDVNQEVAARYPQDALRLGSIARVTAERHGAIRVGTPAELEQVSRVFRAIGMFPTGFYDLRDAKPSPIPVVSTAFRPIEAQELAVNPFRIFCSVLVPEDKRFFDADLGARLANFLAARQLFHPELLVLADRAIAQGGLRGDDARTFLDLATAAFALSDEPIDQAWYRELETVSGVAADIGGVSTTHINHLTPRVLDIDVLYKRMEEQGIEMIDTIQGPPRWDGPDLLLRQTSFRALAEPRKLHFPDGTVGEGELRVRFGEVEQRGIAPTGKGRGLYDELMVDVDHALWDAPGTDYQLAAERAWAAKMPRTERDLIAADLAYFTFRVKEDHPGGEPPADLGELIDGGWLAADPIVYEDFLPRSAAGIFSSNLSNEGTVRDGGGSAERDAEWLGGAMGCAVNDPEDLYRHIQDDSLAEVSNVLGITAIARIPYGKVAR